MHAAVVHEGDQLSFEQVADPRPGPGEVVVELRAAAVNRRDILVRRGVYPFPLPLIPGSDGAGIRRDTGEEVIILPALDWGEGEEAPSGDFRILGGPDDGTYAELVKVPEANVYRKPRRFSWEEAAGFPLAALTAYRALFSVGRVRAGETVLVLGAGGGVSTFAVMLAHQAGARVFVTSSSHGKIERAQELGAEAGVEYTAADWAEEVGALSGGNGVDVVLDSVGSTWPHSLRCLRNGGRCVVFGATGGEAVELEVRPFYLRWLSLLGTTMGSPRDFDGLLSLVNRHRDWRPPVHAVMPLDEAPAAHARMERRTHFGKLVLSTA
jgi:zinc-binding alcohol dehydrogenase/oxidoreductase